MSFQVQLWGVRGSIPAPYSPAALRQKIAAAINDYETFRTGGGSGVDTFLDSLPQHRVYGYGGNTSCIEVRSDSTSIIVDGGSGIRHLGEKLMAGPCGKGKGEVHILMTHYHWDHLIGLPFFIPLFIPGNQIHFHAVSPGLEVNIRRMFCKPNFPVPFEALASRIHFHQREPRQPFSLGDFQITPYQLDHPDPCWGYTFEKDSKKFSYCVDTEGVRVHANDLGADIGMYKEVDVMVFDAQYSFRESAERVDWGHASAPIGLDLAMEEGIKRVYFVHHDPAASDDKVKLAEDQARQYYEAQLKSTKGKYGTVEWSFVREGLVIDV